MKDIRPRAEEKARRRTEALEAQRHEGGIHPPGTGFESERKLANRALRNEMSAYRGQGVYKIPAVTELTSEERILRVAAYCRVSTDDIEQALSIEMQKDNYRDMIRNNPKWRYVGTYVDDGFSGTNTEHRKAFNLMMRDAMDGKIDMIITKGVSRFARNLLDCIGWVQKLQQHDPPIRVFFEQENLDTLASTSNIILFVLAMVAEEESHMKSEAMLLSLEWRFSRGRFITPKLLGYDRVAVDDGHGGFVKKLVINEDQAQTVRLMYYMLLGGSTTTEIAETLTELERETGGRRRADGRPNTHWSSSGVTQVLRNERYCGDVLARKTWTPNFKDHKSIRNRGKKNKYYQAAHHAPIVTRAQWNAVQRILNSQRRKHQGYLPMQVIDHGALCGYISINRGWAGFELDEYYRVSSIVMGLAEGDLEADLENEHLPDGGYKVAGLTDDGGVQRIARELSALEKKYKAQLEESPEEEIEPEEETVREGFQVVSASMFTQAYEPVIRFSRREIGFSSACVARMNQEQALASADAAPCQYVEMLLNPVERMLAVRPCAPSHPNALRWVDSDGRGASLGASVFCRLLFSLMGWDEHFSYRVPAIVRSRNGETALFFDLDNFIGRETLRKAEKKALESAQAEMIRREAEETQGFFYGANDDEEPQKIENIAVMEERLRRLAEREQRTFGAMAFEHQGGARLPAVDDDGEWDVMAKARVLDKDHRVDAGIVDALQDALMEALFAADSGDGKNANENRQGGVHE